MLTGFENLIRVEASCVKIAKKEGVLSRSSLRLLGLAYEDSESADLFVEVEWCVLDGQLDSFMKPIWRISNPADYR